MADAFKALSSPVRRKILALLKERDLSAGELADELGKEMTISKPTLSGHFNILKEADLVFVTRQRTTLTYSLNTSVAEDLISQLMDMFGNGSD